MGNRLLLADDSITIQKVVAIIFANEEFELTVVDNGTAALEKAREIRPDVMLVDALMPGKTGYEVCAEIRRDPRLGSVPILLLIGAFEPLDEEKVRDCGADATISKPFESQQLIDRVKELLELGRTRSAAAATPVMSAAEELWGDLSSFDTMPPVAAPAAPAPTAAAASEPVAPAAAPVSEPAAPPHAAPKETVAAIPAPFEEEIVEAGYEDDLWGAFEMEESPAVAAATPAELFGLTEPEPELEFVPEPEPELEAEPELELELELEAEVEPEAVLELEAELEPEVEAELEPEFEAEEFFSFEDESEAIEETGPALDLDAVEEPVVHPSAEELFSFADEAPLEAASEQEPVQLAEYEPFFMEPPAAAPAAPLVAAPAEPAGEPIPALEPQSTPLFQAAPEAEQVKAQPVAPALSEADLVAALSKISREVIERIVWEVVPDLAEALIKEEIRKLKAGIRS